MAFGTSKRVGELALNLEFQSLFFWNGLWDGMRERRTSLCLIVSILVFLEWPLGRCTDPVPSRQSGVSILVFLEWPLGRYLADRPTRRGTSFNPCFSGMAFGTTTTTLASTPLLCFNPCFSGMAFGTEDEV